MATVVDFNTLSEGSLISDGLIYVSSYKIAPYSNGTKTYVNGMATYQGKFMPFKIWDASLVSTFEDNDLTGHVVKIAGSVKSYKDALEINVQSVVYDKAQDDRSLFLKTLDVEDAKDEESFYNDFVEMLKHCHKRRVNMYFY